MSTSCSTTSAAEPPAGLSRFLGPLLGLLLLAGCERSPAVLRFEGPTMGTTYHVTVVDAPEGSGREQLQSDIDRVLARIDETMSTWRTDSELSRFNRAPPGEWFALSPETHTVLAAAADMHRLSGGAFDVTVGPVLTAWGFGPGSAGPRVPGAEALATAAARVGAAALELDAPPPRVRKSAPREVELSAIAPGYAVDLVASAFEARGVGNYMIEIGGEVRTAGRNPAGAKWRIGIEQPDASPGTPALAIELSGESVSTSGDYREFFEAGGRRYSHTIDPVTAQPVEHGLASVTVLAADCMRADALATAIHVLGPQRGLELAEREGVPAYLLLRAAEGAFTIRSSSAFASYLPAQASEDSR